MSINVLIKPLFTKSDRFYYIVDAVDLEQERFYLELIPHEMKISFYQDMGLTHKLGEIDLSDPQKPYTEIPGIHFNVVKRVAFQASKAIKSNKLMEDISYVSH